MKTKAQKRSNSLVMRVPRGIAETASLRPPISFRWSRETDHSQESLRGSGLWRSGRPRAPWV